jgi:hypothetical protein
MSELTERTNEADIAAVTEVAHTYYDGMVTADEVKLARAFHPNARLVGNNQGKLMWQTLEEFVEECKEAAGHSGAYAWRIDFLSFQGDTTLVRLGGQSRATGTASIYPCFGSTALGASSTRRGMSIPRGRPGRNRRGIRVEWFGSPRDQFGDPNRVVVLLVMWCVCR